MKRTSANSHLSRRTQIIALTLGLLGAALAGSAQTPCPGVKTFATGLLAPSKIIQTPRGDFIVAENGPEIPNHGRVSIVDQRGKRRTLLEGLPSARTFVGDFNGTTGVWLEGRTLFVLNGQCDVTLAGPVPVTERANPTPSSPLFSSVLAIHFSAAMEEATTGVTLTLADHQALKAGQRLIRADARGQRMLIQLVADFPDYAPELRPNFADNVRHSHPYGVVGHGRHLYIVDAGFNNVHKVNVLSAEYETLASFAPTPNPLPGPPFIENVPTSIRWDGNQLAVTLLSGGPFFIPGYSQVQHVDPRTGAITPLLTGLSSAIDITPLRGCDEDYLTLEHNLTFPVPGPGRLQYFAAPDAQPVVLADCLTTPTSMVLDRRGARLVVTELATGRLVTLELP
ncbi:MAG: ScyD/ScyE family protein [Verrucomicrobiae bacterium]|nr:ScyD/ScyE family protein [Verrucomicrobiae bacterium]